MIILIELDKLWFLSEQIKIFAFLFLATFESQEDSRAFAQADPLTKCHRGEIKLLDQVLQYMLVVTVGPLWGFCQQQVTFVFFDKVQIGTQGD